MKANTRIAKFLITLTSLCTMASVNAYQADPCYGSSYDSCCPSPNRCFFIDADYIYWTARQDGLKFAFSGVLGLNNPDDICDCGRTHDVNWDWNSGFKVGAGVSNPCCDWELYANYTYYRSCPDNKVHDPETSDLISFWQLIDFEDPLDHACGKWDFCFNNVDLLVSNEFCVNNCFTLRPSFGLKGSWIDQDFDVFFVNFVGDAYKMHHKQCFWGVGPKFGLTAAASLWDCFSVYGNMGTSLLWSDFENKRNDFVIPFSDGSEELEKIKTLCVKDCMYHVQPVLETSLGIRWYTDICCGDYGFWVKVAWEQQLWFDHNRHFHADHGEGHAHGNLYLQGVTAGAGFSF